MIIISAGTTNIYISVLGLE